MRTSTTLMTFSPRSCSSSKSKSGDLMTKPSALTIAEKFNTYRYADYKEKVLD